MALNYAISTRGTRGVSTRGTRGVSTRVGLYCTSTVIFPEKYTVEVQAYRILHLCSYHNRNRHSIYVLTVIAAKDGTKLWRSKHARQNVKPHPSFSHSRSYDVIVEGSYVIVAWLVTSL